MTELELLKVIGHAQDAHILDAEELPVKSKIIPFSKPVMKTIAAVLAVVLAASLFLQTPMGAAAVETVKERITQFLDILFPPKDRVEYIEGMPETVHVEAQGREPEVHIPGFSIYVDTDSYTMTEEDGAWFIRPILVLSTREEIRDQEAGILQGMTPQEQEAHIDKRLEELEAYYASLPPVEMEIRELPEMSPLDAAVQTQGDLKNSWETVTDIFGYDREADLSFDVRDGSGTYSLWEKHHFRDNSRGGCFHIVLRSYGEANDHGTRFHYMLESFTLVAPQDTDQYADPFDARLKAMKQEVAYAQEQEARWKDAVSQGEMNTAAFERSVLWQDVHEKLWTALEQTMNAEFMKNLTAEHLRWCTEKQTALDQIVEELGGGSLTGAAMYGENAEQTRERSMVLLRYLEGTALPEEAGQNLILDPEPLVDAFVKAYFDGNARELAQYLSDGYAGTADAWACETKVIHAIKGLEAIPQTMTRQGYLPVSVEFRETPHSDSFTYLSITLLWENDRWAVASYGLEG